MRRVFAGTAFALVGAQKFTLTEDSVPIMTTLPISPAAPDSASGSPDCALARSTAAAAAALGGVGIDAIAFAVPRSYLELTELAAARGVAPEKYTSGLGTLQMAIAGPEEDPVTLAAQAAHRVLRASGRSPAEIGLCIVGTETAVDHSKPIASYLHGLLGLPRSCRVFETKHACFGGTAGLLNAVDWIAAGSARGRAALIVCTDIARYTVGSAGEPTQGAGAVAMLVSARPRLVELEVGISGSYALDVHDFWRPLHRKDALVDGHFSVQCYLDALAGAYGQWRLLADEREPLARTCYHVPYGKLARKAHQLRCQLDGRDDSAAAGPGSFAVEVEPSLRLPAQVGNIYTGSLYLALLSLLYSEAAELENKRIGLFSYGSGCAAEFFAGRVRPGAAALIDAMDVAAPLRDRHRLTIAEYEQLRQNDLHADQRPAEAIHAAAVGQGPLTLDLESQRQARFCGIDPKERRIYSVQ